ncbi:hypothetical protein [uncultured Helicobacter sp.]|uniref:hypothetical protein n=1 Tax=uncultured Helicobacter sp. TaxID=175537 RepID=UPI003752922D
MTNFLKKLRFVVSDSNPTESNQDSQKQNLESSFSESKQLHRIYHFKKPYRGFAKY